MNIKQMIAKGLLISLMAGAVTGCSAVREKNIVFNSAQEEPPQTNLTFFGFKYEALYPLFVHEDADIRSVRGLHIDKITFNLTVQAF